MDKIVNILKGCGVVAMGLTVLAIAAFVLAAIFCRDVGWQVSRTMDAMTDIETVTLSLDSSDVFVKGDKRYRPKLVVTLRGEHPGAKILLPFAPVSGDDVLCRFDSNPPHKGDWKIGDDGFSLHFTDPLDAVCETLATSRRLVIRTKETTGALGAVDVAFDLDGFASVFESALGKNERTHK